MRAKKNGQDRGRRANTPSEIPALGWKDVLWRVVTEIKKDRILLTAAGATYYMLLSLFPFLAVFVSIYGFIADPSGIADRISNLSDVLPRGGVELIENQLRDLASQNRAALGFGLLAGLAAALWSANNAVKALFDGLNAIYKEDEKRGIIELNLVSLAFTLGVVLLGIVFLLLVGIVPTVLGFLQLDRWAEWLIRIGRWPVLLLAAATALTLIYRYGPSREQARLRWLTWGAGLAVVVWLLGSWGFSFYLQNFANYNATYGSLGAIIGLMVWIWLSTAIMLIGAKLNAEIEHQTTKDSTTGAARPMGKRGATMADTVGKPAGAKP
jgi:membrane protein